MDLIIYAHPKTEGFCSYILEETKKRLEGQGSRYPVLDEKLDSLYKKIVIKKIKKFPLADIGN